MSIQAIQPVQTINSRASDFKIISTGANKGVWVYRAATRPDDSISSLLMGTAHTTDGDLSGKQWERVEFDHVNPEYWGAVPIVGGGALVDSTIAFEKAYEHYDVIDMLGRQYYISTVTLTSDKTLSNGGLLELANATGISHSTPLIQIGVAGSITERVRINNVALDGNRSQLESIYYGNGEDGGMHGVRISHEVNDVKIVNLEASNCGTAGLAMRGDGLTPYSMKNVEIHGLKTNWNREHGAFFDSLDGLLITNWDSNYNGNTIESGKLDSHGSTAFKTTTTGEDFGAGFDIETYAGSVNSYVRNVTFDGFRSKGNSRSPLIYSPNTVTESSDASVENVKILNCDIEKGYQVDYGFKIVADTAVGGVYKVKDVALSGVIDGYIESNNVSGLYLSGHVTEEVQGYSAIINNSIDLIASYKSNNETLKIQTIPSPTHTKESGDGVLSITTDSDVFSGDLLAKKYSFSVAGGTASGGVMEWTITMPAIATVKTASLIIDGGGLIVPSKSVVNTNGTITLMIEPTGSVISGTILVQFKI